MQRLPGVRTGSEGHVGLVLYWGSGSNPSRRVQLALALKGIPYEGKLMSFSAGDLRTPEFRALNPRGKVPTITDGAFALSESLAILEWLDAKFPDPPLYGRTPEERGIVWKLCLEEENHFDDAFQKSARLVLSPQVDQKADEIRANLPALHAELELLQSRVAGGTIAKTAELSAADLVWYCAVAFVVRCATRPAAEKFELGILPLADRWPGILAWAKRIEAIPGFDATLPPHWLEGTHPFPKRLF
jgi:glutathione S-transferase